MYESYNPIHGLRLLQTNLSTGSSIVRLESVIDIKMVLGFGMFNVVM